MRNVEMLADWGNSLFHFFVFNNFQLCTSCLPWSGSSGGLESLISQSSLICMGSVSFHRIGLKRFLLSENIEL